MNQMGLVKQSYLIFWDLNANMEQLTGGLYISVVTSRYLKRNILMMLDNYVFAIDIAT